MRVQVINRIPRVGQMCGVLALAFGLSIIASFQILAGSRSLPPLTASGMLFSILFEVFCLGLLYLVLWNQRRGLLSVGFRPSATSRDVLHSIGLFFGALLSFAVVYRLVALLHELFTGQPLRQWDGATALFGHAGVVLPVIFVLVNPFFEELLVRAYLMTEMEQRFGRAWLAIVASVALQTSYHLYQGLANAASLAAGFLCCAVYFSRTRRIMPVILAHMYFDVIVLLAYARP